jgi:hypothetical protein
MSSGPGAFSQPRRNTTRGEGPDGKGTWSTSEALEMVDEATSSDASLRCANLSLQCVSLGMASKGVQDRAYLGLLLDFILSQLTQRW